MENIEAQAKELVKHEDGVKDFEGLTVGNQVYDPFIFSPGMVQFRAKEYVFLRHYRLGVSLQESATKAQLSPEAAERLLKSPQAIAWLRDRATKDAIRLEWSEPGKWWKQGDDWLNAPADAKPNKNDVEIWKEFGKRVSPVSETHPASQTKVEINIDAEALVRFRTKKTQAVDTDAVEIKNAM